MKLLLLVLFFHIIIAEGIVIDSAVRNIYLHTHVVRIHTRIKLKNEGSIASNSFLFAFQKERLPHLGLFKCSKAGESGELELAEPYPSEEDENVLLYEVSLPEPLFPDGSVSLDCMETLMNYLKPLPAEIRQNENQKLLFTDRMYLLSPYPVEKQSISIYLNTRNVESYMQDATANFENKVLSYGEFPAQPAYAEDRSVMVHYQYNDPYIYVSKLLKEIEISHWGNLAIEEHYVLHHGGAKLKGGFSRLDFQRGYPNSAPAHFRAITAHLPLEATDVYFRDRIGNISTSDCRVSPDGNNLLVDFLPRFPLFGGWKTTFYIGYNLPLKDYLTRDGNLYKLNTTLSTPFQESPIEELTVKIIIPEGSSDERVELQIKVDETYEENRKTYLDTFGRKVLVVKKRNVVPEDNVLFQVYYNFNSMYFLFEPILVVGGLLTLCLILMVYVRMDFTISEEQDDIKEEREMRLTEITSQYVLINFEREDIFDDLEDGISLVTDEYEEYEKLNKEVDKNLEELTKSIRRDVEVKVARIYNNKQNSILDRIRKIEGLIKKRLEKLRVFHRRWKEYEETDENNEKRRRELNRHCENLEDEYRDITDEIMDSLDYLK